MNGYNGYYVDEQTLREVIETVGKTAAAACISAFLSDVVLRALISSRPTKIVVEDGIPAALYTIGEHDKPKAVYVSSRRSRVDWRPVIFSEQSLRAANISLIQGRKTSPT